MGGKWRTQKKPTQSWGERPAFGASSKWPFEELHICGRLHFSALGVIAHSNQSTSKWTRPDHQNHEPAFSFKKNRVRHRDDTHVEMIILKHQAAVLKKSTIIMFSGEPSRRRRRTLDADRCEPIHDVGLVLQNCALWGSLCCAAAGHLQVKYSPVLMTDLMSLAWCRCDNLMHYYKGFLSGLFHHFWPRVLHNKAVKVYFVSITSGWLRDSDGPMLHFNSNALASLWERARSLTWPHH